MTLSTDGLALPDDAKLRPVCGVVAVAAIAGITFAEAWSAMSKNRPASWQGWTHESERTAMLAEMGVKLVKLYANRTTLNALSKRLDPEARYIIRTNRHVVVVHRGQVLDQYGLRPISAKDGPCRKYVTSILRVEE